MARTHGLSQVVHLSARLPTGFGRVQRRKRWLAKISKHHDGGVERHAHPDVQQRAFAGERRELQ
eukprot:2235228-Pyramimonas_sp.AAC.1